MAFIQGRFMFGVIAYWNGLRYLLKENTQQTSSLRKRAREICRAYELEVLNFLQVVNCEEINDTVPFCG